MAPSIADAVFINGTVGAGKTTTAEEVSRQEGEHQRSGAGGVHALIDVDAVRRLRPSPPGGPFQAALSHANLRDLARNYRDAGATRLVLAGVLETAEEREAVRDALAVTRLLVVRLEAAPAVVEARLRGRHTSSDELTWHLHRGPELAAILQRADRDDLVLDGSRATPSALARRVREAAGWV